MMRIRAGVFSKRLGVLAAAALLAFGGGAALAQESGAGPKSSEWTKRCDQGGSVCVVQTILKDANDRNAGALMIGRTPDQGVVGELRLPTGIYIPSGVVVRVDEAISFQAQLITCGAGFCIANFKATDEVIAAMKKGASFVARVRDVRSGRAVDMPFSLIGFTAKYDSL